MSLKLLMANSGDGRTQTGDKRQQITSLSGDDVDSGQQNQTKPVEKTANDVQASTNSGDSRTQTGDKRQQSVQPSTPDAMSVLGLDANSPKTGRVQVRESELSQQAIELIIARYAIDRSKAYRLAVIYLAQSLGLLNDEENNDERL